MVNMPEKSGTSPHLNTLLLPLIAIITSSPFSLHFIKQKYLKLASLANSSILHQPPIIHIPSFSLIESFSFLFVKSSFFLCDRVSDLYNSTDVLTVLFIFIVNFSDIFFSFIPTPILRHLSLTLCITVPSYPSLSASQRYPLLGPDIDLLPSLPTTNHDFRFSNIHF